MDNEVLSGPRRSGGKSGHTKPRRTVGPAQLGIAALCRLVDSAPEGIALVDALTATCLYVNPAGCALLGQPAEDLAGGRLPFRVPSAHGPTERAPADHAFIGLAELELSMTDVDIDGRHTHVVRFRDVSRSRQHERHLAAFSQTSASIAFAGPLNLVLDRLSEQVRSATGMHSCTFLLMDDDGRLRHAGMVGEGYPGVPDYAARLERCRDLGAPLLSLDAFHARTPRVVEGWRGRTLADPRFVPIHDINRKAAWNTLATVPLLVRGKLMGVLNGFFLTGAEPRDEDLPFLTAIADQAAVAVDNAGLLRALESKAALEERHRLARELHDSVSQALFSLALQTRAIEMASDAGRIEAATLAGGLAEIRELTEGALAEMRALIFQLRPAALHDEGLVSAVRKHAAAVSARTGIRVGVQAPDHDLHMDAETEEQVFRVVQEALHNVIKHASAGEVAIRIGPADARTGSLDVLIADDGGGFDTGTDTDREGHLGMTSMAERITGLDGDFSVESCPRGTTVRARVPLTGPSREAR